MKHSELFSYIKNKKDWTTVKHELLKVEYKVEVIEGRIHVLFQESNEKTDWLSNLDFPETIYEDNLKFHRGFLGQWNIIKDQVIAELTELVSKMNSADVLVSGWSLGSAIAAIAVEDINYHLGIKPELVSFGVPMACFGKYTRDFVRNCCSKITEYCNRNDIVTYVPPIGFYHLNRTDIGDRFSVFKVIHPYTYHTNYDEVLESMGL